jgi:hypothetical protein
MKIFFVYYNADAVVVNSEVVSMAPEVKFCKEK